MYQFSGYELVADGGGLSVRLYLDRSRHEFASDFFGRQRCGEKDGDIKSLDKAARRYIKKRLPGIGLRTAYVLFGAMLVAAIPLTESAAQQPTDAPPRTSVIAPAGDAEAEVPAETTPPSGGAAEAPDSVLFIANKTHPLPSGFVPKELVTPDVPFKGSAEVRQLRRDAAAALEQMFDAAQKDGIKLYGVSGYRSYDRQQSVFAASVKSHGSEVEANQFSARPGESEHQTGLAIDITGAGVGALTQAFGNTPEGKWVRDNADKFGFILRYPEGKASVTGYAYEPWHIRYVGTAAAAEITSRNITLEEYEGLT
ncbi:D-alanyl-D-alanine carboxypeptidase [Sporobacter termitidis DSM 10068]|uniref:D-alanyl-D-alanine carboxypeptidase n=1 Tax=Sporobacter termitidis DSM 10068 TaxID=1123282 RepID=A0A1M5Z011_9FIRM|nr:M15 family metallopeptidase [Sporobacter termitidis]SHI17592.1 D-alanyl-D-alanine carboxypeptidase [Sporobacter termitidis DSM 10068]